MTRIMRLALGLVALSLAACGGGGHGHDDDLLHYPPQLHVFELVDSYGVSSEESSNIPALNPYLSSGLFEVYWDVDAVEDYTVELRVNDRPSFIGSRLISNDYCGYGLACDQQGAFWCDYDTDFSISCDPPEESEPGKYVTYFDDWVFTIPQNLFFLFEVCDTVTNSCEFQIMEVQME